MTAVGLAPHFAVDLPEAACQFSVLHGLTRNILLLLEAGVNMAKLSIDCSVN